METVSSTLYPPDMPMASVGRLHAADICTFSQALGPSPKLHSDDSLE